MLNVELKIGYTFNETPINHVTLMEINGVAEKIFSEKHSGKPYTYMGYILCGGIKSLADKFMVAEKSRKDHFKSGSITIPPVILAMPLCEVNNLLVEIHRKLWKSEYKNQETVCKYCGKLGLVDVDLDKIKLSEEAEEKLQEKESWARLVVTLKKGFNYVAPKLPNGADSPFSHYSGVYNTITLKLPKLSDMIRHEDYADDEVTFWQKVSLDCITGVEEVSEDGEVIRELPKECWVPMGVKIYEYILREDAAKIREAIRDEVPTLPFYYLDKCPCPQKRMIPISMEGNNFFSV
jgi:hypothetical protein